MQAGKVRQCLPIVRATEQRPQLMACVPLTSDTSCCSAAPPAVIFIAHPHSSPRLLPWQLPMAFTKAVFMLTPGRLSGRHTGGLLTKLLSCRASKFGLKSSFELTFRRVWIHSEIVPPKIHCKEQSGMGREYEFNRGEDPQDQILLDPWHSSTVTTHSMQLSTQTPVD